MKRNVTKTGIFILLFAILAGANMESFAQPGPPPGQVMKVKSRRVIHRTHVVLKSAKTALQAHKNYKGDFAKAVAHQKRARTLHLQGKFRKSIAHSRRARQLGFKVIRDNEGVVKPAWNFQPNENVEGLPGDEELDGDLPDTGTDEEALGEDIETVSENE